MYKWQIKSYLKGYISADVTAGGYTAEEDGDHATELQHF